MKRVPKLCHEKHRLSSRAFLLSDEAVFDVIWSGGKKQLPPEAAMERRPA